MNRACDQWCQKASALLLGANRSPDIGVQMLIAVKESRKYPVSIPLQTVLHVQRVQRRTADGGLTCVPARVPCGMHVRMSCGDET